VLLDQADHFVKEVLRVPGYVRYADDLVLFGDDKELLWHCLSELQHFMAGLRLTLHPKKTQLRRSRDGLKFLGLVLSRTGRRLQQSSLRRFNARLRRWRWLKRHGRFDAAEVRASIRAWLAHAKLANSAGVRRAIWGRVKMQLQGRNFPARKETVA
jgi:RNA-directed DNA polymerase